jgi:hypothetical protein
VHDAAGLVGHSVMMQLTLFLQGVTPFRKGVRPRSPPAVSWRSSESIHVDRADALQSYNTHLPVCAHVQSQACPVEKQHNLGKGGAWHRAQHSHVTCQLWLCCTVRQGQGTVVLQARAAQHTILTHKATPCLVQGNTMLPLLHTRTNSTMAVCASLR